MQAKMYGDVGNKLGDFDFNLCVFVDYFNVNLLDFKLADFKVFLNIEPPEVHPISKLGAIAKEFDLILTWNQEIIDAYPDKAHFFAWGSCWIPEVEQSIHTKTKNVSIIASEKNYLEGHKLRHKVIEALQGKIDVYGRGYKFIETKTEALAPYNYSLIIENVKHPNYFTEKLIDCLRTGTVPVYWGTDNINKFFNTKGFITFESEADLINIYPKLTKETYNQMLPYIEENFNLALEYATNYQQRVYSKIKELTEPLSISKKSVLFKLNVLLKHYSKLLLNKFFPATK